MVYSSTYKTVYNLILEQLLQRLDLTRVNDEVYLEQQLQHVLKPFNNDFKEHYNRELEFDISYDADKASLVLKAKNVLSTACLFRSIEDIWEFYDPDDDVFDDGFLRVYEKDKKIYVIDYLGDDS